MFAIHMGKKDNLSSYISEKVDSFFDDKEIKEEFWNLEKEVTAKVIKKKVIKEVKRKYTKISNVNMVPRKIISPALKSKYRKIAWPLYQASIWQRQVLKQKREAIQKDLDKTIDQSLEKEKQKEREQLKQEKEIISFYLRENYPAFLSMQEEKQKELVENMAMYTWWEKIVDDSALSTHRSAHLVRNKTLLRKIKDFVYYVKHIVFWTPYHAYTPSGAYIEWFWSGKFIKNFISWSAEAILLDKVQWDYTCVSKFRVIKDKQWASKRNEKMLQWMWRDKSKYITGDQTLDTVQVIKDFSLRIKKRHKQICMRWWALAQTSYLDKLFWYRYIDNIKKNDPELVSKQVDISMPINSMFTWSAYTAFCTAEQIWFWYKIGKDGKFFLSDVLNERDTENKWKNMSIVLPSSANLFEENYILDDNVFSKFVSLDDFNRAIERRVIDKARTLKDKITSAQQKGIYTYIQKQKMNTVMLSLSVYGDLWKAKSKAWVSGINLDTESWKRMITLLNKWNNGGAWSLKNTKTYETINHILLHKNFLNMLVYAKWKQWWNVLDIFLEYQNMFSDDMTEFDIQNKRERIYKDISSSSMSLDTLYDKYFSSKISKERSFG